MLTAVDVRAAKRPRKIEPAGKLAVNQAGQIESRKTFAASSSSSSSLVLGVNKRSKLRFCVVHIISQSNISLIGGLAVERNASHSHCWPTPTLLDGRE